MTRGIDHLVLCVNDLKNGRSLYEALGFTLTPQAQHPFGTGNVIVQLDGCFLEILSVTRPDDIPPERDGHFNFASFNRDFLSNREGMSMLVLDSTDETHDRTAFQDAGLHIYAPFTFQRQQTLPGGDTATVGFSLTFADDPDALPGLAFFTCKQWRPDLFWKPDYQTHANGAVTATEVFMVADDPSAAIPFLTGFTGAAAVEHADRVRFETSRGAISVFRPDAFDAIYTGSISDRRGSMPCFAGFEIAVPDLSVVADRVTAAGLSLHRNGDTAWVHPNDAHGCVIAFRAG